MQPISLYYLSRDVYQHQLEENSYCHNLQLDAQHNVYEYGFQLKDNVGANISHLFPFYSAYTGIYWIWQNELTATKTHIGVQYPNLQIHFTATPDNIVTASNTINFENTKSFQDYIPHIFPEESFADYLENNGMLLAYPEDTTYTDTMETLLNKTNYERYIINRVVREEELTVLKNSLTKLYPEYLVYLNDFLNDTKNYRTIFVMEKEVFNQCATMLFTTLDDVAENIAVGDYLLAQSPIFALLGDFLFNTFVRYYMAQGGKYKLHYVSQISHPLQEVRITTDDSKYHSFCLAFDDNFAKHAGALLQSIIEHADPNKSYLFNLLCDKVSKTNIELFYKQIAPYKNFKLRFIDANCVYDLSNTCIPNSEWTPIIFARLFLAAIFPRSHKIIYLDCDMIATHDVAELHAIDLHDNVIGAVADIMAITHQAIFQKGLITNEDTLDRTTYIQEKLQLELKNYIQSGLVIFNTDKFRELNLFDTFVEEIRNIQYEFPDQDMLNIHLAGKIEYLPMQWNFLCTGYGIGQSQYFISYLNFKDYREYLDALEHPKLLHFVVKPWENVEALFEDLYFDALYRSPWGGISKQHIKKSTLKGEFLPVETVIEPADEVRESLTEATDEVTPETMSEHTPENSAANEHGEIQENLSAESTENFTQDSVQENIIGNSINQFNNIDQTEKSNSRDNVSGIFKW